MAEDVTNTGRPVPAGFSLGQRLVDLRRHPVLLFGTTAAGKTTILLSLINAWKKAQISVSLGESILPKEHPNHALVDEYAKAIVERKYEDFVYGRKVLGTTEIVAPFFIPLDLQLTDETSPVRLALLECKGEWFEPSGAVEGSIYRPLRDELVDVLRNCSDPLSLIFVAPYAIGPEGNLRQKDSDIGLSGAIQSYRAQRGFGGKDTLLYLLSKWDMYAQPAREDRAFAEVEPEQVTAILERLFPDSWDAFQSIPRPFGRENRWFMQYVAAYITGDRVAPPPQDLAPLFARYPRTLANWIYGNATRTSIVLSDGTERSRERILFPEVVPSDATRVSFIERIRSFQFRSRPRRG